MSSHHGASPALRTALRLMGLGLSLVSLAAYAWEVGPVSHDAAAPGNVAPDASVEGGLWETTGGAALTERDARTGTRAAHIARANDQSDPRAIGPQFPVTPGAWRISGWLKTFMPPSHDPNYSAVLEVEWRDAAGTVLGTDRAAAVNGNTHAWVYREKLCLAPPGTSRGRLLFRFNWSSVGTADLDDVAVTAAEEQQVRSGVARVELTAKERILEPGAAPAVVASVQLPEGPPQTLDLQMDVLDSRGARLTSGQARVEARADRATSVTLSAPRTDLPAREHLVARVSAGHDGAAQDFGLLYVPRPTEFSLKPDSPFALLVGHPYTMRWLGARWDRPNFNWNEREMELSRRYGVIYVGMIGEANQALAGEMSLEDYGAYVFKSVSRFKHLVKYWQQGNEPNLYQPGIPERWAQVLRVGYEAAKRADPDCQVMWGGITALNVDPEMVDKLLAAGGGDCTDIIDVHLYVPIPEMDRLLTKVRVDMAKHGVNKPIVITEVTATLGTVLPEREKAAHVFKRYAVAEAHGVLASWWFVMHWVNTGEFRYCSLIDPGTGEPHEGAAAYARITEALDGAEFTRRMPLGENLWVCQWSKGDRSLYVVWAEGAGARGFAALPCGVGEGTVTDVAGHQWPVQVSGSLGVSLRDEPLLIDVPTGGAQEASGDGADANPPVVTIDRGSAAGVDLSGLGGSNCLSVDAPAGILAGWETPQRLALRAEPTAGLGDHWVILRQRTGDADSAFLRLMVTVTPPLALDLRPLAGSGDGEAPAGVLATVRNLSAAPLNGAIAVQAPVSGGERTDTITVPFRELAPGATGVVRLPLRGAVDPLARYPFSLSVETQTGARDDLQRTLVFAPAERAETSPVIDGRLDDWPARFPVVVSPETGERGDPTDGPPAGPDDLAARAALRWDDANLYLAVAVRDDTHSNDQADGALWDGDGLQFGFAPEPYAPSSAYYEWGVALAQGRVQQWAWSAVPAQSTGPISFPCVINRGDTETVYEMAIPWRMLPPIRPVAEATLGFGLCVNEKDTANRGYYCWHAGIAGEKDRARFGQVTLVE